MKNKLVKLVGGKTGLIFICLIIVFGIVITLENLVPFPYLLFGTDPPHELLDVFIDLLLVFSIGLIAFALIYKSEVRREKTEKTLRESEQKFKSIFDNAIDGIGILDLGKRKFSMCNKAFLRMLGYTQEEFKNVDIKDIHREEDLPFIFKQIEYFIRGDAGKRYDIIFKKKGNGLLYADLSPSLMEIEGKKYITIICKDITERKKIEEALRANESKYRTLLENLPQKIFFKDKNSVYVSCNENYARDLKILSDEITGKTDYDFFPKTLAEKYRADDKRIMQTDKTEDLEEEYLQERQAVFVHTVKTPIKDEKGNIIGVLGIFWDITKQKKAEEVLKESENHLKTLLDSIHTGILVLDPETHKIIDANLHAIQMIGIPGDQLIGHKCHKYICPTEEGKCPITNLKQRVDCSEKVLLKANKEEISILKSVVPIRRKGKDYLIETFTDITGLKKAEEALCTSEAQLSNAMKIAKLGYWEYDVSKDLFTFNDNFYAIFRTSAERVGGYTMSSARYAQLFVHPDDMSVVGIETRKAIETTDPHFSRQLEHRIIYADGETGYITVRFFIIKDNQGRTVKTFGANQDITERKRIEEALRESEEKYRLLIENQGEGIATADLEENFIFTNPAAEKIFGVTKGGLVGRNFKEFTSPEQFQFIQEQTKRRYKGEKNSYEVEIINTKGEKRFLLLTATPWFDKDGNLTSTFGIFRDITERKQLQQQLIQTEKLAAVGTLAYGIAHEFNNILAGMLANAELGLITDDAKQIEKCFNIIAENSYRASSITRNLLAFSSNKEAKKELIDITEPLRSVLAITRRELEMLNIRIVEKFKPVPKICCDAGQLSEVFLNVITNARDAMRAKGDRLTIQVEGVGDNIQIIFEDTGCGIPEKIKGKLFEPFVTTKGALGKSEIPGTGLGLFLSYGIIKGYKGRIEIESEVDKGTRFTITIPVSKNLPCESIRDTKIGSSEKLKRRLKILLVDDEKAISFGLKKFLESRGHQVTASLKAEEGLVHFERERFDLVLSDIAMPDMDGIELIQKIKEKSRDTKVIAITGHILKEKENKAREAGADEVLIKPFKNEVLCLTISKLVAGEV
jgi:PAS domain S-box-containing protein